MNELKKKRVVSVLKYTWPLYILSAVIIAILLNFIFGITHRTPAYQTLTIFVTGEVTDYKKLESDILKKYEDNELKSFSSISSRYDDSGYNTKLTVTGYNGSDVLIIPTSKLEKLVISAFAIELTNELISEYYSGYTLFKQDDINYGIKIDKEKIKEYMTLPEEDCYMLLNGISECIGEYSKTPNKEHDTALKLVKDWGI